MSLVSKDEPGEPLNVSCVVKSAVGEPVVGAVLYVFHTDAQGHYTRNGMDERNPRLFAFMKTDSSGRFEFSTVRPGGYPAASGLKDEQSLIPQHIHFQVSVEGNEFRNSEILFQDDPRMTPYWHEWAKKRNHPVVTVTRDKDGAQHAVCDITLQAIGNR